MGRNIFLLVVLLQLAVSLQNRIRAQLNDGPYVRYSGDAAKVLSVADGKPMVTVFPESVKQDRQIGISFPGQPEWNFSVSLRGISDQSVADKEGLKPEPSVFEQPQKLFLISDVEGEFAALRSLLIAGKVMDEKYNWIYGRGHLVICGDLFDRGKNVVEGLWLLYRLEQLAKDAGGYVHVILGNHDIMNLSGDLRYLDAKYLQSAKVLGLDYMQLYDSSTELGRWLRSKNIIEKIGDLLCMHAGISPSLNKLGLDVAQLNALARPYFDKAKRGSALREAIKDTVAIKLFEGKTSPFWYRGYFMKPKASMEDVEQTLKLFGVRHIVVGHTIVRGNIGFRYKGRVLGLDVDQHEGDHWAAVYENGVWQKINDKGKRKTLKLNK